MGLQLAAKRWRRDGHGHGKIFLRRQFSSGLQGSHVTFRRLFDCRVVMNMRKASRASNGHGQVFGRRASYHLMPCGVRQQRITR
jgi:hypothetical protein